MALLKAERDEAGTEALPQPVRTVPLILEATSPWRSSQPVTAGLPLARGLLHDPRTIQLRDSEGRPVACQGQVTARWSDGSVRWLLLDFLAPASDRLRQEWELHLGRGNVLSPRSLTVSPAPSGFLIDTGAVCFRLASAIPSLTANSVEGGAELFGVRPCGILLDPKGLMAEPIVERAEVETVGHLRASIRLEGRFGRRVPVRFVARLGFVAGTALVRLDLTIHNPQRARHPGGLWDLGDTGSLFFRDLSLRFSLGGAEPTTVTWALAPDQPARSLGQDSLEIYQASSGSENWQSPNHVNAEGVVRCPFRGYRVRACGYEETGLRASPVVSVSGPGRVLSVAVADFWQQFPKALEVDGATVFARLFPAQHGEPFELQGGEQKTHTVWLDLAATPSDALSWVASPARVRLTPEGYAASGALGHLVPGPGHRPLEDQVKEVLDGPRSFFAGREAIDEYGWRHFGEVFADHEQEHYAGPRPFISHYNNQYDVVLGLLQQFFRTGEGSWLDLAGPLARHVCDIDVYHTRRDKPAYNGGLFWFTDHYRTAHTCTHRTYSRHNRPEGQDYGGGPSSNHLFSTGLLYYHYLTGDPVARDVVVELADWVVGMDDGSRTVLGLIDPGPTGLASMTGTLSYHGPGRGCGNSVNTLLDGWLLTGLRGYLDKAEELIRRCVHPEDDVEAHRLLDIEKRWSYTVFLATLARYLDVKAEADELDTMYAYARASLLRYASWMLGNERPYFDQAEKLEYPTEAWAGQELRKANAFRLAAEHAPEPLRGRLLRRGEELADRAWQDLYRFASRTTARAQALVMAEGPRDDYFRCRSAREMPQPEPADPFPPRQEFVPQKQRVVTRLRRPSGLAASLAGVLAPRRWMRLIAGRR